MKLASLNVRGLGDFNKRKSIFRFMKNRKVGICLLQETHVSSAEIAKEWEHQWGGTVLSSFGNNNSRGNLILVRPQLEIEILKSSSDEDGRIIMMTAKVRDKKITVVNIYGPNIDSPEFFTNLIQMINEHNEHDVLILGDDFNLVLNPDMDRLDSTNNHEKSLTILQEYME